MDVRTSLQNAVGGLATVLMAMSVSLVLGEVAIRVIDNYPLSQLKLPRSNAPTPQNQPLTHYDAAIEHAKNVALSDGVSRDWFISEDPAPFQRATPADWKEVYDTRLQGTASFDFFKLWNSDFVQSLECDSPQLESYFSGFPGYLFVFSAEDGTPYPRYRFIPNSRTPMGLRTNQYGLRGPDIAFKKELGTIRIAVVGASTTVQNHRYPFSYPELLNHWLNLWAQVKNYDIKFEVMNFGREGINSTDIASVVRSEAVPLDPDYILYYEGSNQFWPGSIVKGDLPSRRTGLESEATQDLLDALAEYSAVARRVQELMRIFAKDPGAEEDKPELNVVWPADVDEKDPDLESPNLPINLPTILNDLENIRKAAAHSDAQFIMTSFKWLVEDGMKLDPVRHQSIHRYLNVGFYPYSYQLMERLAAFQNLVFAKYAQQHEDVEFIDIAALYPSDPDLFVDAIHQTYGGVRLRAWTVLQELIPVLEKDIQEGRYPRPARETSGPPVPKNIRTVEFDCGEDRTARLSEPLTNLMPLPGALMKLDNGVYSLTTKPEQNAYSAEASLPEVARSGTPYRVRLDVQVEYGSVQFGVLTENRAKWINITPPITESESWQSVWLTVPANGQRSGPLLVTNASADGVSRINVRGISIYEPRQIHPKLEVLSQEIKLR